MQPADTAVGGGWSPAESSPAARPTGVGADSRAASSLWQGLSPGFVRDAAADRLKALAHSDRLRIVEVLAGGPKTVSQISASVGRPMNAVSRNLRVLRDARVVQASKRGNSVLYVLADRDVVRLAAAAYRGAGSQVRKVAGLVSASERGVPPTPAEPLAVDIGSDGKDEGRASS
jgi:DNA-binding transcriptional ArsR family regulator